MSRRILEIPWYLTVMVTTFNIEGTMWLSHREPHEEFKAWLKEHIPNHKLNSLQDWALSMEIDENDTEGRALLKLTWGIG